MRTADGPQCVARNATRGTIIAERVGIADSLRTRLRGLLGTTSLDRGHGLLIRPCRQVHSFFMRYPIDLVFVDEHHRVVWTVAHFRKNRVSPLIRRAVAVLELPEGALAETPIAVGDLLCFEQQSAGAGERETHAA